MQGTRQAAQDFESLAAAAQNQLGKVLVSGHRPAGAVSATLYWPGQELPLPTGSSKG